MKRKKHAGEGWADEFDMAEVEQAASDWEMPPIREPDFSDVRKKIRSPAKLVLYLIIAAVFWIVFFIFGRGCLR